MKQLVTCISAANTLRCVSLSGLDLDQPSAFTEDTLWACVHVLYKTGGEGGLQNRIYYYYLGKLP